MSRPRPWLLAAVVVAFAILVSLGCWQLQRLAWKQDLLGRIEAARAAPVRDMAELGAQPQAAEWARARVTCAGSGDQPPLVRYALVEGEIAWRALAPCAYPGGLIWVDRGVIAGSEGAVEAPPYDLPPPREVIGLLRPEHTASGEPSRRSTGPLAAYYLAAERETPQPAGVRPAPTPPEISNRHLEYALTWFGLAGALVAVYAAVLIQDRRRPRSGAHPG